jgi:putative endonuclease
MGDNRRSAELGESLAAAYLVARGYRVLDRRWRTPGGELDLVVVRDALLVFVEVKTRGARSSAPPETWVLPRQQRLLRRTARAWLAAHGGTGGRDCRFDVVGVRLDADGAGCHLRHLAGAF